MSLTMPQKIKIVAEIRGEVQKWWESQEHDPERGEIGGYCLFWSAFTVKVLKKHGVDAQIQAGSSYWPCLNRDQYEPGDVEKVKTFGYEFERSPATMTAILNGYLPEMHCWACIVETQEIIDLTTKYWPQRAKHTCGLGWPGKLPPDFLWSGIDDWPDDRTQYRADREAIRLAYQFLRNCRMLHLVASDQ